MAGVCLSWKAVLTAALLASAPALAQGMTDPGDLAFWDSIKSSTGPAEYREYLKAYPNGRFAALARLLAGDTTPGGPAPVPDPPSDYSITIVPAAGRVGQQFTAGCGNIPFANALNDKLIIVPAGLTVVDPDRSFDELLWSLGTYQCVNTPFKVGPFAPGAYEIRWMTRLFNNDRPFRFEVKAKAAFTVR